MIIDSENENVYLSWWSDPLESRPELQGMRRSFWTSGLRLGWSRECQEIAKCRANLVQPVNSWCQAKEAANTKSQKCWWPNSKPDKTSIAACSQILSDRGKNSSGGVSFHHRIRDHSIGSSKGLPTDLTCTGTPGHVWHGENLWDKGSLSSSKSWDFLALLQSFYDWRIFSREDIDNSWQSRYGHIYFSSLYLFKIFDGLDEWMRWHSENLLKRLKRWP